MRWRFAQGTISFQHLPTSLCQRDNLISANAMAVCARWSTSIAVAIAVLRKKQSSFRRWKMYFARISNHGIPSRKYHWRPADDGFPFVSSSLMVKQLRKSWCENIVVSASQENRRGRIAYALMWAKMKTTAVNKISSFNGHPRRREGVMLVDYSPVTVGAYCIRPSCERTWNDGSEQNIIVLMIMLAAVEGVCNTPLHICH